MLIYYEISKQQYDKFVKYVRFITYVCHTLLQYRQLPCDTIPKLILEYTWN